MVSTQFFATFMNKTGLIAKISIKYVLPTCIWKYFLRISRYFAEIPEFRGSATARNIRSPGHVKTIQYNAMHKFVRVLDNPFVNLLFNFFIIQWNPKNSIGLIGTAKICSFKIFRCGHTQ